jgi:hexosaminidase
MDQELNSSSQVSDGDRIVESARGQLFDTISRASYIPWKFHPRNADFEPDHKSKSRKITAIKLQRMGIDPPGILRPSIGDVDESYSLQITVNGEVNITARTSIGLSRALVTLSQLFYKHSKGGSYTPFAPVDIQDNPIFPYRGFNIDLSRSFFEKKDILRTIDALAMSKFNVLHLHMTDSQSWPLEIPSMPGLSDKGAYRKDLAYSPEAIKDIQDYGALRGIQVYLEIDMPGHTAAIWYSHPELIANFNVQPWGDTAAEPPTGVLKLNEPKVYKFVAQLFSDLLPRLSPYTSYFHTGGDELKLNAYLYDDTVKSNDTAVLTPLVQKFVDHSHSFVRNAGLTPIVWEEMILFWNLNLGRDTIVQAWNEDSAVAKIVEAGYRAIGGLAKYWVSRPFPLHRPPLRLTTSISTVALVRGSTTSTLPRTQATRTGAAH